MSSEECLSCEYDISCWGVLKFRNKLSSDKCGNYRKKRTFTQKALITPDQVPK